MKSVSFCFSYPFDLAVIYWLVFHRHHIGPTKPSRFPDEERNALCEVLENHREDDKKVVAWIHGHSHKSDFYYWDCPDEYQVSRIPIFNMGSPYYAKTTDVEGNPGAEIEEFLVDGDDDRYYVNGRSVHFTLFRLGNRTLEAMDVSALPGPDGQPVFQMSGIGTPNFDDDDDENPDGLYGGWIKVIEDHLNPPRE